MPSTNAREKDAPHVTVQFDDGAHPFRRPAVATLMKFSISIQCGLRQIQLMPFDGTTFTSCLLQTGLQPRNETMDNATGWVLSAVGEAKDVVRDVAKVRVK